MNNKMKNTVKFVALLALTTATSQLYSQELQLNQSYGQAALSNPALLCADGTNKVTMGYHTYYGNLSSPWREYAGTAELGKGNSAFGIGFVRSEANQKMSTLNGINLMYRLGLKLSDGMHLRVGFQGGMRTKSFNMSPSIFEDMIDPYNGVRYETRESLEATQKNYFGLGAGLAFNTKSLYLSLGLHNVNRPNTAYNNSGGITNKEPMSMRAMLGYNIRTQGDPMKAINQVIPYVHFVKTGNFNEIAGGIALQNEVFNLGVGYHTYSYKASAVMTTIGFTSGNLKLGYNFGVNMGTQAKVGGSSHEICLSLLLFRPEKPESGSQVPMPMF
jgi:type IX secretion system PorP/SprF family membrane protein